MSSRLLDPLETVLVADFGRDVSRGYLLEQIGGQFRFVAKAEHHAPLGSSTQELSADWRTVIDELSWQTGRGVGEPLAVNGNGADALLCVSSLASPARVLIIETGLNASSAPIVEKIQSAHAVSMQLIAPSGRKDGGWLAKSRAQLAAFAPEIVICIATGANDALQRALQLVKSDGGMNGLSHVIVIADGQAQDQIAGAFNGVRVRRISAAARDAQEVANEIERDLLDIFRLQTNAGGVKAIAEDSAEMVMSRAHAVDLVNRLVATSFGRRTLSIVIDDGSHVHWASGDQSAMTTLPELGIRRSAASLNEQDVRDAVHWLPFEEQPDNLVAWVKNRSNGASSRAESAKDKAIEQALARQIARRGLAEIQKVKSAALADIDLVIGSSTFAEWEQPGSAALTLLDCIDQLPNGGVLDLALDRDGLMIAAGALATLDPTLAASVFEQDALSRLGCAVIIGGSARAGDLACRGEIRYVSGESSQFSLAFGSIEVLPLRTGESASMTIRPERGFSVGGRPAGETVHFAEARALTGGTAGVIIDARPRPLLSSGPGRATKMKQWLDAANGNRFPSARKLS